jgi:hypothetical protein
LAGVTTLKYDAANSPIAFLCWGVYQHMQFNLHEMETLPSYKKSFGRGEILRPTYLFVYVF